MSKKRTSKFWLESIEPRLLFSADAVPPPDVTDFIAPADSLLQAQWQPAIIDGFAVNEEESVCREVVFIDATVDDIQTLVDDLNRQQDAQRQFDVVLLDGDRDGIEQISEYLSQQQDIAAVHIISHGSDGEVVLGNSPLNLTTLDQYAYAIEGWQQALTEEADLLFYGCNLASGVEGQTLLSSLSLLTGADVAASDDLTGNATRGGDWVLEYTKGEIQTDTAFSFQVQQNWEGVLDTVSGKAYADQGTTALADGTSIHLLINGNEGGTALVSGGNGSFSIVTGTISSGDAILLYIDDGSTYGTTVTVDNGGGLSGIDLYANHLITRNDNGGVLTNALMDTAKGSNSDPGILYSVSDGNLTVLGSGTVLYIPNSESFVPGGDVTTPALTCVENYNGESFTTTVNGDLTTLGGGTFTLTTGSLIVNGDFVSDKNFDGGNGTVEINGNLTILSDTFSMTTGSLTVNGDLIIDGNFDGGSSTVDINGDLNIINHTFDATSGVTTVSGDFNFSAGTFKHNDGTIILDGTGQSIFGSLTFFGLEKTVTSADTLTFEAGEKITIDYAGSLILNGDGGELLVLESSIADTAWELEIKEFASVSIDFVNISDADASSSHTSQKPVSVTNAIDGGGNTDMTIMTPPVPTPTIVSAAFNQLTGTLTLTGTNFTTIAAAGTNIKSYLDYDQLVWDINKDGTDTLDIGFSITEFSTVYVTNDTTLTMNLTAAKANAIAATDDFGLLGGADSIDIAEGFLRNAVGEPATTDALVDGTLTTTSRPTADDNAINLDEDTTYTFDVADFNYSDGDGNPFTQIIITALVNASGLQLSGTPVVLNQVILESEIGSLTFTPLADTSGSDYSSFKFKVYDGTYYSQDSSTMTMNVDAVNDLPVFASSDTVSVKENLASVMTVTATDVETTAPNITYSITNGADKDLFSINATGDLAFLAAPDFEMPADVDGDNVYEVEVTAKDQDGGVSSQTISIFVVDSTVLDQFTTGDYSGNDGPSTWTNDWIEIGETTNPSAGVIQVSDSKLRIGGDEVSIVNRGIKRTADFSGATTATLSYTFQREQIDENGGWVFVEVSSNGSSWSTLKSYHLATTDAVPISESIDVSAYISASMQIRIIGAGADISSYFYIDDVKITDGVNLNNAPSITSDGGLDIATINVAENSTAVTDVDATDPEGDTPIYSITGGADAALFGIDAAGLLTFSAAPNFESPSDFDLDNVYEVEVTATDSHGGVDMQLILVTVTDVNEAPTLGNGSLSSIDEDTTDPAGDAIFTIFAGQFADVDFGSSFTGVAVIGNSANPVTEGNWQYSTNAGLNWYDIGTVADDATALALDESTLIRFLSVADYSGTPATLIVRGLDNTYAGFSTTDGVENRVTTDASLNGADTSIAEVVSSISTVINEGNDTPELTAGSVEDLTVAEDSGITSLGLGGLSYGPGGGSDESGQTLTYTVTAVPAASLGEIVLADGTTVVMSGSSYSLVELQGMQFKAADNANGGPVTFSFTVTDNGTTDGGADPQTLTQQLSITVTEVNDAPTLTTGSLNDLTVAEDSGITSLGLGGLSYSPGGGSDESGQTLTYTVTDVPAASLGEIVLADGTTVVTSGASYSLVELQGMQFKAADNAKGGPAAFSFTVTDNGTTDNVEQAKTLDQTLAITVSETNDAPVAVDDSFVTDEDRSVAVDLLSNDTDNEGDSLTLSIPTSSAHGDLVVNDDGTVIYTPHVNFYGTDSFTYTVSDCNGGTAIGLALIIVNPVADTPIVSNVETLSGVQTELIIINRNADDGAEVCYLKISEITGGTLYLSDGVTQISDGSFITVEQGQKGVKFSPAADNSSTGSFRVEASLDGISVSGTANATATITILPHVESLSTGLEDRSKDEADGELESIVDPPYEPVAPVEVVEINEVPSLPFSREIDGAPQQIYIALPEFLQLDATGLDLIDMETSFNQGLNNLTDSTLRNDLLLLVDNLEIVNFSQESYEMIRSSLDSFKEALGQDILIERAVIGSAVASSVGLSAGYVLWMLKGGSLLASVLSSIPAWHLADPLSILVGKRDEDEDEDEDEETLRTIIEDSSTDDDETDKDMLEDKDENVA